MDNSPRARRPLAVCANRSISQLAILAACLSDYQGFTAMKPWHRPDAILGWGRKPTSRKARQQAKRRDLPYIALEDGFLRSWGLGVSGYQPHSLVVDTVGIYYDATRPSELEQVISSATFSTQELERAKNCMALLRHYRLSKYNHAPERPLPHSPRPQVLVVDQTAGDASIKYGLADAERFQQMLDAALEQHPDADILVKIHPDVVSGHKQGHLLKAARMHPRCQLIAEDISPWSLFDAVDSVHVVTSQLGFEALLAGCQVVCHGMPFYAGWGLTQDHVSCSRRGVTRRLDEVFAATYLRYCRYANPYTGRASSLEATIDLISDQKRRYTQLAGNWLGVGFSRWKRRFVGDFLGELAHLRHQAQPAQALPTPSEKLLVWSSQQDTVKHLPAAARDTPVWRMEDGFIRSVGLGVDLVKPLSLVVDSCGIHYDPEHPSDLEQLLANHDFPPHLLERAKRLRERLVESGLSKYNINSAGHSRPRRRNDQRTLLVIGQVETDASVRHGSPWFTTNSELLSQARAAAPDAWLIYKPHPDVVSGARLGSLETDSEALYDECITDVSITDLLLEADELHTLCSLAGFEALLRGCHVVTYGTPFYAGWGLTEERGPCCPRRQRKLSLDELVAGCLILYPLYVDPYSHQVVNAETVTEMVIHSMMQSNTQHTLRHLPHSLYRWYRNTFIGRH
ncbi:capsular polysaccharide biosynthesis protein [Halomonas halocynthiae]|uniref:capsular polysaccharide biosynthesis protein n=1 Tax=Halomonas halocynthiae TaxID=176290 RepID=UPI000419D819|nr:capsular polysaccharide biosynthesis protein [Halomonas halocynthiae]